MDSHKVTVKRSQIAGSGVFALDLITPGEVIASFDGPFYQADYPAWTKDLLDHAIQCGPSRFRDSVGLARLVNHSCEPNCGIQRLFDIVAMRTIIPGEEITWDYEMTEDSEWWRMECHCGVPSCRRIIGAFRNLPDETRKRYRGFISDWLLIPNRPKPAPSTGRVRLPYLVPAGVS